MGIGTQIGWPQASAAGPIPSQGSSWGSAAVPQPQSAPPRMAPVIPLRPRPSSHLSILYTGQTWGTCAQRADALRDLGHDVVFVPSGHPPTTGSLKRVLTFQLYRVLHHLKRHPDVYLANARLLRWARRRRFDVVWIDKGVGIRPRTLRRLKRLLPGAQIIAYSTDDMFNPDNQSHCYLGSIALYDLHVTTKSFNVQELEEQGARDVLFVKNAYDPLLHKSMVLSTEDRQRLSEDRLVEALVVQIGLLDVPEMGLLEEARHVVVIENFRDRHLRGRQAHLVDREDRKNHAAANRLPTRHGSHTRRGAGGLGIHAREGHPLAASLLMFGEV